jgi:2-polyprenyl-3-methyl-5-hydroxy-6-metoxy-1,4-benzoquinol methylase
MTYRPAEFWDERLRQQFDLRGTGETGLSLAYNDACYRLRREVLDKALAAAGISLAGKSVLDVGCGTGFFTRFYLERGARVTGLDIARTSVERLAAAFPQARFMLSDVSEVALSERYDVVNAFDVLYHITDEARWETALRHLAEAVAPGGVLLVTDVFLARPRSQAEHNRMRTLERYRAILDQAGVRIERLHPTHVLLNRDLGPWRFLNRFPGLLYRVDKALLAMGLARHPVTNRLLVARRAR